MILHTNTRIKLGVDPVGPYNHLKDFTQSSTVDLTSVHGLDFVENLINVETSNVKNL